MSIVKVSLRVLVFIRVEKSAILKVSGTTMPVEACTVCMGAHPHGHPCACPVLNILYVLMTVTISGLQDFIF